MMIVDVIKKRSSIRTYDGQALKKEDKELILKKIDFLENPFGVLNHVYYLERKKATGQEKLGTYGLIKGAKSFLGISFPDEPLAPLAVGYEFEDLILYATSLGLGTVWLAATFQRDRFEKAMHIKEDHRLAVISPIGYPAKKRSLTESMMRQAMKASSRKAWDQLFFKENFHTPLPVAESGEYGEVLEMVRLAPSAKNEQPWRVIKDRDSFHFYASYKSSLSDDEKRIKEVDVGIGLAHFHKTALEKGLTGHFEVCDPRINTMGLDVHYLVSWKGDHHETI